MDKRITAKLFMDAFTRRHDDIPMQKEELLKRLNIMLTQLKQSAEEQEKLVDKMRQQVSTVNVLRGALIRMGQFSNDKEIQAVLDDIISLSMEVFPI